MKLHDALYNWLQIKLVAEARPSDGAAKETLDFFARILTEDHGLREFRIREMDEERIVVEYSDGSGMKRETFDRETTEQLLHDINANPKYNE
jgi:hypothetical protein